MQQMTAFLLITALLLVGQISAYQRDAGNEDYGSEGAGPPGGGDASFAGKADSASGSGGSGGAAGSDPGAEGADKAAGENEAETDPAKTKFTDERFAKLFPARTGGRNFVARNVAKPKPTLPSFIKSTQPAVKVQVSTTPVPKGLRARATVPTTKRSLLVSTTARPRRGGLAQPTQRQLSGRLPTSKPTTAPNSATASATPSAAALAAARRARQGNGVSRFNRNMPNSNSTIPALNPRRN